MSQRDKWTASRLSWILVAFIVPALIIFSVYTFLCESKLPDPKYSALTLRTEEFDRSFIFEGVNRDLNDLSYIREAISEGDGISSAAAFRTLITEHVSLVFLLGLLIGPTLASELFKAFFYFRFGFAGAAFFYFANNNLKLKEDPSLLMGTLYSLSSVIVFSVSGNTASMNMVILLPILLSCLDSMNREMSVKRLFTCFVLSFLMAVSGAPGLICGIPAAILSEIFLLLSDKNFGGFKFIKSFLRTLACTLLGALGASVAVFPIIKNLISNTNYNNVFENGKVRYPLIDFIYKCLDGNISGIPSELSAPVMGIYVVTLMLLILFFINGTVPFRSKTYLGLLMLIIYITVSYSPIDEILSFSKPGSVLLYSRLACLVFIIAMAASLSLRNVREVTVGSVYVTAFLILGLIIIESSSLSEASLSIFSRFFSAGAVIFWTGVLIYMIRGYKEIPSSAITAAILAIGVVVWFAMGPSYSHKDDITNVFMGSRQEEVFSIDEADKDLIPLFGDDGGTYVLIPSDIQPLIIDENYCDVINTVMRGAMVGDLFIALPADSVYIQDMDDYDNGRYGIVPDAPRNEATIRVYLNDLSANYFVVSSFACNSYVTESYGDIERTNSFSGPFLMRMNPSESPAYVKLSLSRPSQYTGEFKVYMLDPLKSEYARLQLRSIDGNKVDLSGEAVMGYAGTKTVVTSIPYSSNITVTYSDHGKSVRVNTFEVCGKLAFSFESDSFLNYVMSIGCESGDIKSGAAVTAVSLFAVIFIYLMYNNKTARRVNKETYLAEQKD